MAAAPVEVQTATVKDATQNGDKTAPTSLAIENLLRDVHGATAQSPQIAGGRDQTSANRALENTGILPATSIVGAEHPSPVAEPIKPKDMVGDANRLHAGLLELHNWTGRSNHNIEKDLRDTLATMNSTQIAALNAEYKSLYGSELQHALVADTSLSTESKQALAIYLKGADQRKPADSLALADIGTRARNLDMFEEAFRDAAPEARSQYLAKGGESKIKAAFGGIFSDGDVRHAMDYVKGGRLSLETQITDNTGVFTSNREAIEHALGKMTTEQKGQYQRGEEIAKSVPEFLGSGRNRRANAEGLNKLAPEQKDDLSYYRQVHSAMQKAGNNADLTKWQNEINAKPTAAAGTANKPGTDSPSAAAAATGSNTTESARDAFNSSRDKEYKSNDGIGRAVVRHIWDGTSDMTTDELNQYAADMSRAAAAGATISKERQEAHQQGLDQTLGMLKESKTAAADALVDSTMIVAGVGGAALTGGASLALLGAVGASGAAIKIGAKSAIVGSDYQFTAGHVLADGASGAVNAAAMFIGPAQVARVIGLGGRTALAAGEHAVTSLGTEVALNSTAGALGGAASGTVEGVTKWDSNKSVSENLARVGNSALVRGATGAVLAGVMSGTIGGAARLARVSERAPLPAVTERAPVATISEKPTATTETAPLAKADQGGEKALPAHDVDGRPLSETQPRREVIESKFAPVAEGDRPALRAQVQRELQDVKATGLDGKPTSAYDSLMQDKMLNPGQKENVLNNLGLVREHLASYRLGDRMHPDPEVNWIHTQGEIAKVLEAGRAKGLNANDMEDSLLASMYSDSVKFSAPSPEGTVPNFHTHHLDGALAADHSLRLQGFPQDRTDRIVEAILAHQIAPPKFMGQLYYMKINGSLEAMIKDGKIGAEEGQKMRDVLANMTEVGPDGVKRIRQLANVNDAPRTTNVEGMQQVDFTPEQQKVFALSGTDRWILPYDPKFDTSFKGLTAAEKQVQLSRQRIAGNLIDGDAVDNYATTGGASKIVAIRGPQTFFADPTVWDSIASIGSSFKDAYSVLTPEGQRLANQSLAGRNQVTDRAGGSLKTYMDAWLKNSKGLDASSDHIPFYNQPLTYPKTGETPTAEQQSQMELAKEIRTQIVDFLRRDHRTDNSLPGNFTPARTAPSN
jgi:hypothetical protein